jgi:aminopeptidase N
MKSPILILLLFATAPLLSQSIYWQQKLSYDIKAELNEKEKTIRGFETIVYKNNAPEPLEFIWFHIWPNAYKNDSTALMRQIRNDAESKKTTNISYGSIDGLAFKINDQPAQTTAHPNPQYIDVIKLVLNSPLASGDSITISTPFTVTLPKYFSRSGYSESEFMACQWYPKPAVFDQQGWHEFPYLDMGEFYSEYADYSVSLTVPANYVVGATGTLTTKEELNAYKRIGGTNASNLKKSPLPYTPVFKTATKTLQYVAQQVPDFAWFADKNFVIQYDTIKLKSGKIVDAFSYYHDNRKTVWVNSLAFIKDAIHKYSAWIGEYEYPVVQVAEGPKNNSSGGMEYPMITLITAPDAEEESLDAVITHEVGHNWFMSMLGSNERDHTWMDEGLNTYFQFRYEAEKYRGNSIFGKSLPKDLKALPPDQFLGVIYNAIDKSIPMNSAMDTPADQFPSSAEYSLVSYVKTALWMYLLESAIGKENVDLAIQNYFAKWKNKHPRPEDMQAAFEEATGKDLAEFFKLTKKEGRFE